MEKKRRTVTGKLKKKGGWGPNVDKIREIGHHGRTSPEKAKVTPVNSKKEKKRAKDYGTTSIWIMKRNK